MNKQEAQKRLEAIKREADELEKLLNEEEQPWYAKLPANTPVECRVGDGWMLYYAQGGYASAIRDGKEPWDWSKFDDIRMPEQPWWDSDATHVAVFNNGDVAVTNHPSAYSAPATIHTYRRSDHE